MNIVKTEKSLTNGLSFFIAIDETGIIKLHSEKLQVLFPGKILKEKSLSDFFETKFQEGKVELVPKMGEMQGHRLSGSTHQSGADLIMEVSCPDESQDLVKELQSYIDANNRFLITTTHELKSPMSVLLASTEYLELMTKDLVTESLEVGKCFKTIKESCFYLSSMVDDLMDVASFVNNIINLKYESVDIVHIVNRVTIDTKASLKDYGCEVNVEAPKTLNAKIDPIRFEQAITNLLVNACKYGSSNEVLITVSEVNGQAVIAVKDRGIGIASEDFEKIFKQFSRSTDLHHNQSFGIGLFIVKAIVDAHKGQIGVESQINKGSTFTIKLPLNP